jgi:hypothetical protein
MTIYIYDKFFDYYSSKRLEHTPIYMNMFLEKREIGLRERREKRKRKMNKILIG